MEKSAKDFFEEYKLPKFGTLFIWSICCHIIIIIIISESGLTGKLVIISLSNDVLMVRILCLLGERHS